MNKLVNSPQNLGTTYVLVIGDDPEWQRMCDNFARICDFVAPMGQTVAVERIRRFIQGYEAAKHA